ncbi:MAG: SDR family oxidoreductase [Pirellulaceae bacterium]|nr:SDR family oxidoreductase [Pirellulaceae bacterium]
MNQLLPELFGTEHPVALITGSGARRVGQVIARQFVEAGYRVVLHAHRSVDQVQATARQWQSEGFNVDYVTGAIDDQANIHAWCDRIVKTHGGLHVLVNSAAAWEPTRLEELDESSLNHQWRVNLMGPTLLCREAGLIMASQSGGAAIVNIGDWALVRPYLDFAAYLLSKGAIQTLTQAMAVELALRNPRIRVNAVLPGPVMLDQRVTPEARQKIIAQSLLKREGTPEDVAQAVRFLVESPFITGVCLPVDGGRTIYAGPSHDIAAHPTYEPN